MLDKLFLAESSTILVADSLERGNEKILKGYYYVGNGSGDNGRVLIGLKTESGNFEHAICPATRAATLLPWPRA